MIAAISLLAGIVTIWAVVDKFLKNRKKVKVLQESEEIDNELEIAAINERIKAKKEILKQKQEGK